MKTVVVIVSLLVLMAGCPKVNHPPDNPAKPEGPTHGVIGAIQSFATSATDPDRDEVAIRFVWSDGDTSGWSSFVSGGQSITLSHAYASANTYQVRAQAKDYQDALSGWSEPLSIVIASLDHSPATPAIPTGPTSGIVDSSYSFTATSTDPNGDSIAIRFDWGDGDTSGWSSFVASGQIVTLSHTYASADTYQVRAQAKDTQCPLSGWSEPLSIVINHSPAAPAIPTGPTNGIAGRTYSFTATSTDPDGDSIAIRFDWGDGDTSAWGSFVTSGQSVTLSHTCVSADTYQVRAQAKDNQCALSGWSEPFSIVISPLDTPALVIRHYAFQARHYYVPGYWWVDFSGYVVDTADFVVDSVVIHAKLDCFDDTLAWVIADSLAPGDSAGFSWSSLVNWGQPYMQRLWATCK